jgi:hypothetical protein
MYTEIKGRLRAIDHILNGKNHLFLDSRLEQIITELKKGLEFVAEKVYALEHKPADPHGYIPGNDD